MKDSKILSIYFGVPGSGKSTFAAYLSRKCLRHHVPVYSNVPIIGCNKITPSDLGTFQIDNGKLIIDEAGLDFNNRNFKSFTQQQLTFFKLHRHYHMSIDVFSQTYNDMDLKIRSLAQRLYVVKRSFIPFHIVAVPVFKKIGIDEDSHQIQDIYYFDSPIIRLFSSKRCFMPFYWKYFDSYSAPKLLDKLFSVYSEK